ncbi:MAG TPA: ABC transporter permease [Terriglobia bacterium]|nr:ABC transporter permease [Terriglobia bacterium]
MELLIRFWRELTHFLRRGRFQQDLAEEMREHVEEKAAELAASGMPAEEARLEAQRQFGNALFLREKSGDAWGFQWLETLLQDLRFGLRQLRRNPGFTAVAIITLALGIGASTAIFSVVDAVLLRPLPYPNPQQIVTVWEQEATGHRAHLADPNFEDFRAQNRTLSALAVFYSGPASVSGSSEPARVNVAVVSQDFFKALGVEPFRGRAFVPDEEVLHGAPTMIVSYGYWRQFLGATADLSHIRLSMDGTVYPVIGVMPPGFDFPAGVAAWVARERYAWSTSRTSHNGEGIGRLREGVSTEQARADLDTIARRIHAQYGQQQNSSYFLTDAAVIPLADEMVGNVRAALLTLFGAVILLFLVACANVAGLLLVRASARHKEFAVRAALGAGRGRLLQQWLGESLALALAGGALGILLAAWMTRALPAIAPASLPRHQGIAINAPVLLFSLAATLVVAVGLGLFAAWRTGGVDLSDALSAGSRNYSGGGQRLRSALVVGEIAATVMLLVGAGLLGRSFLRLISVSPGFSGRDLLVLKFTPPRSESALTFGQIAQQTQLLNQLVARVRAIPGVQSAGLTGALPIADPGGFPDGLFLMLNGHPAPTNFDDWGRMAQNPKQTGEADYAVASAELFHTLGIPLIRGRLFNAQDGPNAPNVALISQTLAREKWPHANPIGQVIDFSNMDGIMKPLTIVGVVGDIRAEGLEQPPTAIIYVDYRQRGLGANSSPAIVLRTSLPPGAVIPAARGIFHELDPNVPVQFSTFAEALDGWTAEQRFLTLLAVVFGGASLSLAAIGIYGLVAQSVARRTQEIGIRMALGAQKSDVLRLVIGEGARLAAMGVVIGVALSLAVTRLIVSLLYSVKPTDPLTFVIVSLILACVALLACYIPARRATKVDPMVALRYE